MSKREMRNGNLLKENSEQKKAPIPCGGPGRLVYWMVRSSRWILSSEQIVQYSSTYKSVVGDFNFLVRVVAWMPSAKAILVIP